MPDDNDLKELLTSLFRELRQAERSAERHCARESHRLRGGPAEALAAVSEHAAGINRELAEVVRAEELDASGGDGLGTFLSTVRDAVVDRLIERERSYRMTLLGLRHGVDVVRMIRHVADTCGRVEIGGFCTRWLNEREPLVARVEQAMSWFAHHPQEATEPALPLNPLRRKRVEPVAGPDAAQAS